MKDEKIRIVRSNRKTVGISIDPDGIIVVKAPHRMPEKEIWPILMKHKDWIEKHQLKRDRERQELAAVEPLTMEDIRRLAEQAGKVIPERVAYYAPRVGVSYGKITIRNQKSRWGSCTAAGNLNFNCLLMLTPPEVLDSVVVHELCHRIEMNHSDRFYREVYRVYPEYDYWHGWLKEHGGALIRRMTG